MRIEILQLIDGARKARGLTVIIDVFRAFSTACYAFNQGAARILPAGSLADAFALKAKMPEAVLIGEVNERMPDGFDYGNSPTHILQADLIGKTLIQRTSAGTQGIMCATGADEILTGSFVNAQALVDYILQKQPLHLSLVCMGYSGITPADEDTFCAQLIRDRLLRKDVDFPGVVERLRSGSGFRLLDPANHAHSPSTDFELCTQADRFSFILQARPDPEGLALHRIEI